MEILPTPIGLHYFRGISPLKLLSLFSCFVEVKTWKIGPFLYEYTWQNVSLQLVLYRRGISKYWRGTDNDRMLLDGMGRWRKRIETFAVGKHYCDWMLRYAFRMEHLFWMRGGIFSEHCCIQYRSNKGTFVHELKIGISYECVLKVQFLSARFRSKPLPCRWTLEHAICCFILLFD